MDNHKKRGGRTKAVWAATFENMETGEIVNRQQYNEQQVLLLKQGYKEAEIDKDNPVYVRLDKRELVYEVMTKDWRPVTVGQAIAEIQEETGRQKAS